MTGITVEQLQDCLNAISNKKAKVLFINYIHTGQATVAEVIDIGINPANPEELLLYWRKQKAN
jgi:hypothetical protein